MRKVLLLLLLILSVFLLKAQPVKVDSASFFSSFRYTSISVTDINFSPPYTFKEVKVLDYRPDTFHIGFYRSSFVLRKAVSLEKEESLQNLFSYHLQNDSSDNKILIVVNHLNIQNIPSAELKQIAGYKFNEYAGYITYTAKIYLDRDSFFIPLLKIDTAFLSKKNVENAASDLLESVLIYTSKVIKDAMQNNVFAKRRHLTINEMLAFNPHDTYPDKVNTDTTSGIYLTFDDFLHHRLTENKYRLELFKDECYYIYIKQPDGSEYITRDIWGICDNGRNYIMNYGFLFPLYKAGNAFFWNGFFLYRDKSLPVPFMAPIGSTTAYGYGSIRTGFKMIYAPYLLNMTTGNQF